MSSPSHAPASAAGSSATAKPNENGVSHSSQFVRTQEPSSSKSADVVATLTGNRSLNVRDESHSLRGEMQVISSVSQTESSSSQALGKPPTPPPKCTQQSQDQPVSNGLRSNGQAATSLHEIYSDVEGGKSISASMTGHERNSVSNEQQPNVDTRNPNEDATPLHTQTNSENLGTPDTSVPPELQHPLMENSRRYTSVAGLELDEQVVQIISAPLGQVDTPDSTMIADQGKFASHLTSGASQESVQLGDSSSHRRTPVVEGTPVVRVLGVPAGDGTATGMNLSTIESVAQSQMSLLHTAVAPEGATVVGMVGTTPIVRLPEASKRVVTKKRGRFKVFQPVVDVAPADSASSSPIVVTEVPAGMILNDPNVAVARGQEATIDTGPVATKSNQPSLPLNDQEKPQTFEGTGAPVVKRKGRFFVTNLKDPGLIAINIHPQVVNGVPTSTMPGTQATVESYQVTSTYVQSSLPTVVIAPGPSDAYHAVAVAAPPVNSSSVTSSTVPVLQQNQSQQQVQYDHSGVQPDHTGVYIQEPYYQDNNAQHAVDAQQSAFSQQNMILPTGMNGTNFHSESKATEPNEVAGASEKADNLAGRPRDHSDVSQNHKLLARRYQSAPKSARDENLAPSGLGKVFHFLDQMRIEVSQADKMIKTLQADTRLLKEKNKELEAKVIDAEKRFREERALREAADAKLKALRKKVRSMREGTDVQKEDDSILASARRPEDTEHAQSQGSPGANGKSFVHSTEIQRTKSPERDRTKKGTVESHSVPATPDATKKPKSTSLENVMNQNATEKALPPTPPVSRRKGASSPNVPVPKPSPSHSRVNSTPHIPSHTGLFNNSFSNQMQTRNVDASPVLHTAHVPHMAGSAQRELGTQHFASTNFDPLAPKNPATPDQDTVTLTENPPNNFDPFSSAAPPNQYRGTGLQYNQGTAMNVMQPAPTFAMNHNNLAVPVYGLPGTSFERLDQMTMQNQQRMQGVDLSQIRTPSSSVHERQQHILQQSNCQESLQPVLLVPQQTFEVHVDSQMHPNQFAPDSGSKTNVEQNISTQGPWSQQQHGSKMRMETQLTSDGVPALSSQSRLNMSSDPFDELLNRANQS